MRKHWVLLSKGPKLNQTKRKEGSRTEVLDFSGLSTHFAFLFMAICITVHVLPWESCTSGDLAWTCHTLAFVLLLEKLPIPFIRKEIILHLSKLLEANRKVPPVESKAALAPCHTFYPRNFQETRGLIGIAFIPGKPPWFLNTRKAQEFFFVKKINIYETGKIVHILGYLLILHLATSCLISCTHKVLRCSPGVIPEHRTMNDSWAQS